MGNWAIVVRGVGCHHNIQRNADGTQTYAPTDANKMTADFVRQLIAAGHTIQSASFTHGADDDLTPPRAAQEPPPPPPEE